MNWKDVLNILRRENPILFNSLDVLSQRTKKAIAEAAVMDNKFLSSLTSSRAIRDEYNLFVADAPTLLDNVDFFRFYATNQYSFKKLGKADVLSDLAVKDHHGRILLLNKLDGQEVASISDGIVSMKANGRLFADNNIIKGDLMPNSMYKIIGEDGLEYAFNIDQLGRIIQVSCKNISPDELLANVLRRDESIVLDSYWPSSFRRLKQSSRGKDLSAVITYSYIDDGHIPQSVHIESSISGKSKLSQSFTNVCDAANNEKIVKKFAKLYGLSPEKQNDLFLEMSEDADLAKLIQNNPDFNINRWLNTRNKPDRSKIAILPNGRMVDNGRDYAGNVFYFETSLNRHLQSIIKNKGHISGYDKHALEELDRLFPNGVRYTEKGFPDFVGAGVCKKANDGSPIIIDMPNGVFTGDRDKDFQIARSIVKEKYGDLSEYGYIWHHLEDPPARLVLVDTRVHEICRHSGGYSMLNGAVK